ARGPTSWRGHSAECALADRLCAGPEPGPHHAVIPRHCRARLALRTGHPVSARARACPDQVAVPPEGIGSMTSDGLLRAWRDVWPLGAMVLGLVLFLGPLSLAWKLAG